MVKNLYNNKTIQKKPLSIWDGISSILFIFVLCVFVVFVAFSYTYTASEVVGESMLPTFHAGDVVYYRTEKVKHNDIVIVKLNNKDIIKRVIGVGGDKIEIRLDVNGYYYVYRNNERLNEPYINGINGNKQKYEEFTMKFGESVVIPEGHYFVLGDNRANSGDSTVYGLFNSDEVLGVVDYTVKQGNIPLFDLFIQLFLPIFK